MSPTRLSSLFTNLFRKARVEQDLDEELRAYFDLLVEEKRAAGLGEADAGRAARLEMEGLHQVKERVRAARAGALLEQVGQDLSYGFRMLRRSPGVTLVALVSLGLGIGGCTAVFSVADALFWRALPVFHPEQLVQLMVASEHGETRPFSPGARLVSMEVLRPAFAEIFTAGAQDGATLTADGYTERVVPDAVSGNYFAALGVPAFLGRTFSRDIESGSWAPEAVLNFHYWQTRFGGDRGIVGRAVLMNGYPFTIVGVMPPEFCGVAVAGYDAVWVAKLPLSMPQNPMPAFPLLRPDGWPGYAMARLAPGTRLAEAESMADALFRRAALDGNGQDSSRTRLRLKLLAASRGGVSDLRQRYERPLMILAAVAILVLLVACTNVASLLLGRATARRQEIAVRLALGASRARLIRQLLTESLLIAASGGMLGAIIAGPGADLLLSFIPQGPIPLRTILGLTLDLRVLGFSLAVVTLTAMVSGLVPALHATRVELAATMKGSDPAGRGRTLGLRQAFVVGQVALSLLLLVGAALFVRTLLNLQAVQTGFDPRHLVEFTYKHVHERYTPEQLLGFGRDLLDRVRQLPTVRAAGLIAAEGGPLWGEGEVRPVFAGSDGPEGVTAVVDRVSPQFFDTLGIPRFAGRDFSPSDRQGSAPVAIVDQTLAQKLFGAASPLGRRLTIGDEESPERANDYEVVGVVGAARHGLHEELQPAVYLSVFQMERPWMPTLVVRTQGETAPLVAAVRAEFTALDPAVPVFYVQTVEENLRRSLSRERLVATLSSILGGLAAFLAAIGLYAVVAYSVTLRTREIGVRVALGSPTRRIVVLVMREALRLVALGIILGLCGSAVATRAAATLLFGITAFDPLSVATAVGLLLGVGVVASYVPARRAARIDPMQALRCE